MKIGRTAGQRSYSYPISPDVWRIGICRNVEGLMKITDEINQKLQRVGSILGILVGVFENRYLLADSVDNASLGFAAVIQTRITIVTQWDCDKVPACCFNSLRLYLVCPSRDTFKRLARVKKLGDRLTRAGG